VTETLSCGTTIELLPIGARVRHKRTGLLGKVVGYERHESGKKSALPYKVYWDDNDIAAKQLGWLFIYPAHESLEEVSNEQ